MNQNHSESAIPGNSVNVIKRLLKNENQSLDSSSTSLAEQVREFIYHREKRDTYDYTVLDYSKSKELLELDDYDVILNLKSNSTDVL